MKDKMKTFMNEDFLLSTETARSLYHDYAALMPIVDYHCHISPREIYENRSFENLTELWLAGDHYKWRLMRANGTEERYITGNADDKEKFVQFVAVLQRAVGNPMYHWCHMELNYYFGYEGVLNEDTADYVWDFCRQKLREPGMTVRGLIAKSKVKFIGTTDDPADSLEWHKKLKMEAIDELVVAPTFRPDRMIQIDKPVWRQAIVELGVAAGISIVSAADMKVALQYRMNSFAEMGCRAADHGMEYICYTCGGEEEIESVFHKAYKGEKLTLTEIEQFKTEITLFCAREYAKRSWVMQIHYNCIRNLNTVMLSKLGPDTGFDAIGTVDCGTQLAGFFDCLYQTQELPKTIIYSLNPSDNPTIDTIISAFQGDKVAGKLQHGSAWWFNDTKTGMIDQLTCFADTGVLGNFIGMLTDSRSFSSYVRHEYFRRILCALIGGWIEQGEYPADITHAGKLIQDICYNNAYRYFSL